MFGAPREGSVFRPRLEGSDTRRVWSDGQAWLKERDSVSEPDFQLLNMGLATDCDEVTHETFSREAKANRL